MSLCNQTMLAQLELSQMRRREKAERAERIRHASRLNPELKNTEIARRFGCSESVVQKALRGMQ